MRQIVSEHLQSHLGSISRRIAGVDDSWDVLVFDDEPMTGAVAFASCGLSSVVVRQPDKSPIRQELLLTFRPGSVSDGEVVRLIDLLSGHMRAGESLLRGSLHGLAPGLLSGARNVEDLYVTLPVYFDDALRKIEPPSAEPIVLMWAVPLVPEEARWLRRTGWKGFEEILEVADPDLTDPRRRPAPVFAGTN